jgi:hypothetical protein
MKIESRVEALEHELKILKNEIQSTLLEIREQILNHYYPELRAEEPPSAKSLVTKPGASRTSKTSKGGQAKSNGNPRIQIAGNPSSAIETKVQIQPFSDIFLQDLDDDDNFENDDLGNRYPENDLDDDIEENIVDVDEGSDEEATPAPYSPSTSTPKTREVVFHQLKQATAVPKTKMKRPLDAIEFQGQRPNRRTFAALAAWIGDSVAKVGKERTIQVVETYAASGGALSAETKSSLLQLASLASDEEPTVPVGNQQMLGLMVELDQILGES